MRSEVTAAVREIGWKNVDEKFDLSLSANIDRVCGESR